MSSMNKDITEGLLGKDEFDKENSKQKEDVELANLSVSFSNIFFGFFNCFKMIAIIGFVIYAWLLNGTQRDIKLEIVHQLSKDHILNETYHHDAIFSNNSYNSAMNMSDLNLTDEKTGAEDETYIIAHANWPVMEFTDDTNTTLVLSHDIVKATKELMRNELFDKTFILLIIFCVSWKHTA